MSLYTSFGNIYRTRTQNQHVNRNILEFHFNFTPSVFFLYNHVTNNLKATLYYKGKTSYFKHILNI